MAHVGRSTMLRTILALCLVGVPLGAKADNLMPPMPVGMTVIQQGDCVDHQTRAKGYCVFYQETGGDGWLVFLQDRQVMFLRHIFADGKPYEQAWTADQFNSF